MDVDTFVNDYEALKNSIAVASNLSMATHSEHLNAVIKKTSTLIKRLHKSPRVGGMGFENLMELIDEGDMQQVMAQAPKFADFIRKKIGK